jgi:peptide/nickel transport system permease protein
MTRFVAFRLLGGVATLWAVSVLVFSATELLPGDAATAILGREATPAARAALRERLGLDRPAVTRYLEWLKGMSRFDFGHSLTAGLGYERGQSGRTLGLPVATVIRRPLIRSSVIVLMTLALLVPLSLVIGTITALRHRSAFDAVTQVVMLAFTSLPEFVMGAVLIILFALVWPVLPAVSLDVSPSALVLPVMTLVTISVAYTARMIRAGVIEVLQSDHVAMARLKGLPEHLVIRRHVLANAVAPSLQAFALLTGWFAGGIVIVEALFAYPGLGQGLVSAVSTRDIPVVQAYTVILAGVYVVVNLVADLLTVLVSPRLRTTL